MKYILAGIMLLLVIISFASFARFRKMVASETIDQESFRQHISLTLTVLFLMLVITAVMLIWMKKQGLLS